MLLYELSSYSRRKLGSVVFLICRSSCLYLRLFAKSKARTSRRGSVHPNGYLEASGKFCIPLARCTVTYLTLATLRTPFDYLYLVGVLHRHLYNLRMSFRTTWKNFISLSCLLWRLSVPFFSKNGKYKACSFAWEGDSSS